MSGDLSKLDESMFTDEEIRTQLKALGFENVSDEQFQLFKIELERLVDQEKNGTTTTEYSAQSDFADRDSNSYKNDELLKDLEDFHLEQAYSEYSSKPESRVKTKTHVLIEKLHPGYTRNLHSRLTVSSVGDELENVRHASMLTPPSSGRSSASGMSSTDGSTGPYNSRKEYSSECSSTTTTRLRKRKVLRKTKQGTSVICDESISQSSETSSNQSEYRHKKPLNFFPVDARNSIIPRPLESASTPGQAGKKWRSTSDLGSNIHNIYKSKSVILPYSNPAQAQNYLKTDPVALYHYYKRQWANHNIPGERDHKQLRWNIRTMMASRDDVRMSRAQSRISFLST